MDELLFTGQEVGRLGQIAKYYTLTKELIIFTEQVDPSNRTLPQAINELRNCLDHLMRIVSFKMGISDLDNSIAGADYIETNFNKAYGHVYRAAYDTLDWLSLIIKDRIIDELQGFSLETINDVLPEYFTKIRPRLEQILGEEMTTLRTGKDVASTSEENLVKYTRVTAELKSLFNIIIERKPSLIEHRARLKNSRRRKIILRILENIAVGVIVGILVWILT